MNSTPYEDAEQAVVVQYCTLKGYKVHHSNNEMWTKSIKQKVRAKRLGVSSGFPDLVVIANKQTMFIEMKRKQGGLISPTQKEWIKSLEDAGELVTVAKGADEAIEFIEANKGKV